MRGMRTPRSGGGWSSIAYAFRMARRAGGVLKFWRALRSRNACKTCALGMGGQRGGMVNEAGQFPEVCKKSMQAMAADMQGRIRPEFYAQYPFAALRSLSPYELEHMGRIAEPVYAGPGDGGYRPISWDAAITFCVQRLKQTAAAENFFYASGRSSNEAAFLLQLIARLYGTNNVNNCSYYCHQASGVGLSGSIGSGTGTLALEDLDACDLLFLIGGNPASNHPRLMRTLMEIRRRGGEVIVINPLREVGLVNFRVPSDVRSLLLGSQIASMYVMPHIGGDIPLLVGVARALLEEGGALDRDFISNCTDGFDAVAAAIRAADWDRIERDSGVERAAIREIAARYARSRAAVFAWTMGITHHVHGVDNVRAIVNLALLRGMLGRPGAGLLPIRGHSNVQGVGSVGVTPRLKDAVFQRLESHFGVKLPTTPGMDTLSCIEAMGRGEIRNAWCLGGNLFGATPDAARTVECFARLDSVVYLSTTLNTGHAWGRARETLILPVKARDEESQSTTQESMFNYVRLSDGGAERLPGPRSEVEVLAAIAAGFFGASGPVDWAAMQTHRNIRAAIGAIVPGYEQIAAIDETRREFRIDGRVLHRPQFATKSGRAHFHVTPLPACERPPGALRLMTIRSEGQFNTVVYEEYDAYRGQERRDVILMHADDIAARGLRVDQCVVVRSETGEMRDIRVRPFDIRAGNAAMYYPESNVLIPFTADRESRTPAYKSIWVQVLPREQTALTVSGAPAGAAASRCASPEIADPC